MAKRKKQKRRHRRRVGALGLSLSSSGTGLKLLSVGAGFLLGNTINGWVDTLISKTDPTTGIKTVPAGMATAATVGEVVVGALLLMKKGGGTTNMIMQAGGGILAGAGLKRAVKQMGLMSGYQSVPVIGKHRMSGYQSVPVIGNTVVPPQLAGRPAQLQGYKVSGYTPHGSGVMAGVDGGSGITTNSGSGYMN